MAAAARAAQPSAEGAPAIEAGKPVFPARPAACMERPAMNDAPAPLPDRLSVDPRSPHHDAALLNRGVGIRFNGAEKTNVEEYCVSEGWVRVAVGKTLDRKGNPLTIKLQGKVEPYVKEAPAEG
jgi:hypothetical protein